MTPLTEHAAFRGPITLVQLARDGAWENAWSFPPTTEPSGTDWETYLADRREIAFEVFFGAAFFGARFMGEPRRVCPAATACLTAVRAAQGGEDFFAALARLTGLHDWGARIDWAEIGAVNAWRSVGPHRFDIQRADPESLVRSLAESPLGRDRTRAKAVEFAGAAPVPHWFALPLSRGAPHQIEPGLLAAALASVR